MSEVPHHHSRRMVGRDPRELHRVATPLELFFDLTFATSFSLAASQFARAYAAGHFQGALLGFGFASLAICWAWMNFSWFSSAYDTDDWIFRIITMVQMVGVLVLAIGLPRMFASIESHQRLDNSVMVLGYVIMRVALVVQWLRASAQDRARRRACLTHALTIFIAQVGWVALLVVDLPALGLVAFGSILALIEFAGPMVAERHSGGTPWHAHHIAERHSLFAIIALGEGIVGTAAALSAVVDQQGFTVDAALVGLASSGLVFGMWWVYHLMPSAEIIQQQRNRAAVWSFMQMLIVTAIVATGGGLEVAASFLAGGTPISELSVILAVAIPVAVFLLLLHGLYAYLMQTVSRIDLFLLIGDAVVVVLTAIAAAAGVSVAWCLVILLLALAIPIAVYEVLGDNHHAAALADREVQ
jgi:low temperature requirement protein LtrA